MRTLIFSLSLILFTPLSLAQTATDKMPGRSLHDKHCQRCHDDSMYSRPDSIIFSLKALDKRVKFCERMADAQWGPDQLDQVIAYLNQRFYKFKVPQ